MARIDRLPINFGFLTQREIRAAAQAVTATEQDPVPDAAPSSAPGEPKLYLYDFVGSDWMGEGVTAMKVVEHLGTLDASAQLDVHVNSPGGDVFEGVAIYNAIARFPGRVVVHVDALAASIASLIAMAGDEIVIAENAMVMVHHPYTTAQGDAAQMRATASTLDKAWSAMLATYQRRTGKRAASIDKNISDAGGDWWMTATEAVAAGFADRVEKPKAKTKARGLHVLRNVPDRVAAALGIDQRPASSVREIEELAEPRVTRSGEMDQLAAERRRRIAAAMRVSLD